MADGKPPEIVTVGRIVHYVMAGPTAGAHRAAIVVATGQGGIEDSCELTVFLSLADPQIRAGQDVVHRVDYVPFDPTGKATRSWHWPERDNGLKPPTVTPAEPS